MKQTLCGKCAKADFLQFTTSFSSLRHPILALFLPLYLQPRGFDATNAVRLPLARLRPFVNVFQLLLYQYLRCQRTLVKLGALIFIKPEPPYYYQ